MNYRALVRSITDLHSRRGARAGTVVNQTLVARNWTIGAYIIEFEQNGEDRARYGEGLLRRLSADLGERGIKGASPVMLKRMSNDKKAAIERARRLSGKASAAMLVADRRASKMEEDHALATPNKPTDNGIHELDPGHSQLAPPPAAGAAADSPRPPAAQSGAKHGVRRGTGGPADTGTGTRPPHAATRYLTTTLGVLSYAELAPHLARRVEALQKSIADGEFDDRVTRVFMDLLTRRLKLPDVDPPPDPGAPTERYLLALRGADQNVAEATAADGKNVYTSVVPETESHHLSQFALAYLEALVRVAPKCERPGVRGDH